MKPKKTILCVDDDEQVLSIRKVVFETRGYRVLTANNGRAAFELFRQHPVDLVLTDLLMPELDGVELTDRIKTLSPSTPVVLYSGKVKIYERENRADVFLPKGSITPADLLERVRILMIKKRGPKKAVPTPVAATVVPPVVAASFTPPVPSAAPPMAAIAAKLPVKPIGVARTVAAS
jgi:two-component system, OmpR family, response regulator CpxR